VEGTVKERVRSDSGLLGPGMSLELTTVASRVPSRNSGSLSEEGKSGARFSRATPKEAADIRQDRWNSTFWPGWINEELVYEAWNDGPHTKVPTRLYNPPTHAANHDRNKRADFLLK